MADQIGIELDSDTLYLTRGRDFKWLFENQDTAGASVDYPAGDLYFELDTKGQHNALQQVELTAANGGSYNLLHAGTPTADIAYYDATTSLETIAGFVQDALEVLPSIGAGNVLVHPAQLYPVWELNLTLGTGHNEIQLITFTTPPTSGTWKLGYGTAATAPIPWNATAAQVQTALEGIAAIGTGNVKVTGDMTNGFRVEFIGAKANTNMTQLSGYSSGTDLNIAGWLFGLFGMFLGGTPQQQQSTPIAKVTTLIQGQPRFNSQLIDLLDTTITNYFNSLGSLSGVTTEFTVHDQLHATVRVTSLKAFTELGLITFQTEVTSDQIVGVFNNVAAIGGAFDTIAVNFYWNQFYQVEFIGDLAETAQDALGVDTTKLTGVNSEQAVEVTVLKPGKPRFTKWPFTITGSTASLTVQSEDADAVNARVLWQLVFLPEGEAKGGDPIARGKVAVQE